MIRTIQAQGLRSFTIVVRITATVAWRNAGPLFCFAVGGHGISPKVAFVSIESASMAPLPPWQTTLNRAGGSFDAVLRGHR
ncbi:MAG: hypothetical protein WAO08_09680 [Hyphomicrobiaceae bacterium]